MQIYKEGAKVIIIYWYRPPMAHRLPLGTTGMIVMQYLIESERHTWHIHRGQDRIIYANKTRVDEDE